MDIMDCTLRDGANVVGKGFSAELTTLMLRGLIDSNIKIIELGHATGLGSSDNGGGKAPLSDEEYLDLIKPYSKLASLGMFLAAKNASEDSINLAAQKGLHFLRVGANAGDAEMAKTAISLVKKAGLSVKYSMMKAYVLSPDDLAQEAGKLEAFGVEAITIMDSAGYMLPQQAFDYTEKVVKAVNIPVGFHGHNNLGLATANALAVEAAGAAFIDCGLMGMARSAGNIGTETIIAALQRNGKAEKYNLYKLLSFIENELRPKMLANGYHDPILPIDLILGYSGAHSSYISLFEKIAKNKGVDVLELIVKTSLQDRKSPNLALIEMVADDLAVS